jgi:hypothetical protein
MNEQLTPRNQQLQFFLCKPKSNRKESWSVYLFICLVFFNLLVFKADVQTPRAPKDVAEVTAATVEESATGGMGFIRRSGSNFNLFGES